MYLSCIINIGLTALYATAQDFKKLAFKKGL